MFKEKLVIDIMKKNYSKIQCLVGDTLELDIDILVNGEPFNIESFNVSIEQGLENGNFNIQNDKITKNKNNLICSLSNRFTSIKGKHFIDISIVKEGYKKTTFKLPFEVHEGAIPEDSLEQEVVISIIEELKAEILKAQELKEPLISSINQATTIKNQLNEAITEGKPLSNTLPNIVKQAEEKNTTLTQTINTANNTNTALRNTNNSAKQTNTTLSNTVNVANSSNSELQNVLGQATTIKNQLNTAITEGETISNTLPNTIKQAEQRNATLTQTISTANNANTTLGNTNNSAKQTNTTLSNTVNTANNLNNQLQDVINQANIGNLVTKEEFSPIKNKTERLDSIKENGGIFAGYRFSEWSLSPLTANRKSLGNETYPFKDVFVNGSALEDWGYCKLTNGLMLCWGTDTKAGGPYNGEVQFNGWFKTAFPNSCLKIVLSLCNNTYDMGKFTGLCLLDELGANERPLEGFKWKAQVNSQGGYTIKVNWIAIGF